MEPRLHPRSGSGVWPAPPRAIAGAIDTLHPATLALTAASLAVLVLWTGIGRARSGCGAALVGDPDQAIYGFAGADPRYLNEFEARFPGARTVRLAYNYRSTPQVVVTSRSVLPASRSRLEVHTPKPDGPAPTITEHDDERRFLRFVQAAEGLRGALRLADGVARGNQTFGDGPPKQGFVVDDDDHLPGANRRDGILDGCEALPTPTRAAFCTGFHSALICAAWA